MNWYKLYKLSQAQEVPSQTPDVTDNDPHPKWDPLCAKCRKPHGFLPDTTSGDCPWCGTHLESAYSGGPLMAGYGATHDSAWYMGIDSNLGIA